MKIILFDLGNTLEHKVQNIDVLMPGALELLSAARKLGMMTIRLRVGEADGEVNSLFQMIPLIHLFVLASTTM